jgi:hypothetical protein
MEYVFDGLPHLQVAGVDNKVARYREDRQLAQRLTPFAERCAAPCDVVALRHQW